MRFKKQLIVLGIAIAIVATITYALSQTNNNYPNPGHPASEIGPGTFNCPEGESCFWDFPGDVNINEQLTVGSLYIGSNKKSVTFRVNDLLLGHPERMENPGIALVAGSDTLFVNYGPDWPYTSIGGKVTVSRSLKVKEKLGIPYTTQDTKLYVRGLPEKFAIYGEIPTSNAYQCVSVPCTLELEYDPEYEGLDISCVNVTGHPDSCNGDPFATLSNEANSFCEQEIICPNSHECGSGGAHGKLKTLQIEVSYEESGTCPELDLPQPELFCYFVGEDEDLYLYCEGEEVAPPGCTPQPDGSFQCLKTCYVRPRFTVTSFTCNSIQYYQEKTGDTVVGIIGKTKVSGGYLGAIIPNNVPVGVYGYVSNDNGYAGYFKGDLKVEGNKWEDCHVVECSSSGWCNCSDGEYVAGVYREVHWGSEERKIKCCKL